jgi:hypothetical protein
MDTTTSLVVTVSGFVIIAGMIIWSVYTTQRSFKTQTETLLIMARMLDRIERMTEKILTQLPDEDVQH